MIIVRASGVFTGVVMIKPQRQVARRYADTGRHGGTEFLEDFSVSLRLCSEWLAEWQNEH